MDERELLGIRILDEGGRLMDEKKYAQARDAYKKMENSTAPEDYKEMARQFARQAQEAVERRRGF
ncbi:MAG: hypothetical protein MUF15_10125 [Acidobacteria bacterium]|jgi:hypothetical protein|nr:hypothetical protein [Acidobacteriota bacterium]